MLLEININNFALIDKVSLTFEAGLNIITGETGAGKSIIIDALGVVLGGKVSKDLVRNGAEKASIEAVFDISNYPECTNVLDKYGIEFEDDNTILLSREIYINGKSICKINGRTVTLSMLKYLSHLLVDIHGQNEHQSLISKEVHLEIIDRLGGLEVSSLLEEIEKQYNELKNMKKELEEFRLNEMEKERKLDIIKFQLNEIDSSSLKIGEDEELSEQKSILSNGEKIYNSIAQSYLKLYSGHQGVPSLLDSLSNVSHSIESVSRYDKKLQEINGKFESILYQIEDITVELREYKDSIHYDSNLLEEIENRLYHINNLKRKYGGTISEIIEYRNEIAGELNDIENSDQRIKFLEDKIHQINKLAFEQSVELSNIRKKIATSFENNITKELVDLNMPRAKFVVNFNQADEVKVTAKGIDDIEFLISTNFGEPVKPLIKVASGGEISRIMLGLKTIISEKDSTPTMVFDEIDTGISGRTAQVVAEKMSRISKLHQILCITHLPQIASMGDCHFYIEKIERNDKTITQIRKLNYKEKIEEIARLIGGTDVTELTLNNAKEILDLAQNSKKII